VKFVLVVWFTVTDAGSGERETFVKEAKKVAETELHAIKLRVRNSQLLLSRVLPPLADRGSPTKVYSCYVNVNVRLKDHLRARLSARKVSCQMYKLK